MHNPPKNPTCCWTVSQIPKPRVAGVRVCMDTDFGVSIPQPRGVWVNTREGWGGCPGLQHPDPAMQGTSCHSFHQFFGKVVRHRKSSTLPTMTFFFNSIFLLYYLSTYRHPARSSFHHGATSSKCGSKNSLFSPSVIHDPLVLHTRRKMICHCSWRGWGNWLLWLQQNLFPGCFELIILEVLHPSQLSKHHLE